MTAAALPLDAEDVCSFGHQLVPGSDPIVLKTYDDTGRKIKEETFLLRRHAPYGAVGTVSVTDPTKLVSYPCDHAIPEADLPEDYDLPPWQVRGPSYGRTHWLTFTTKMVGKIPVPIALCPVCRGEPAPDWRA